MFSAPFARSGIYEVLGHKLVYVVVVAVLDAGADAPGPRRPQPVSDPALPEGRHLRCRAVRRISCVEGVGEIEVLDLDRVTACGYPREDVPVAAHWGEGGIVLDPAQHVRYTCLVHKLTPYGPGSGVFQHRRGHFFI
jgi:hypothetical protein